MKQLIVAIYDGGVGFNVKPASQLKRVERLYRFHDRDFFNKNLLKAYKDYDSIIVVNDALIETVKKPVKYNQTLHNCIDLLKQEGSDTKQQVLEKLEELVNAKS